MIHFSCASCGKSVSAGDKYIGKDCKCPSCGRNMVKAPKPVKPQTFWKWMLWELVFLLLVVVGWVVVLAITQILYSRSTDQENPGALQTLSMDVSLVYLLLAVVWSIFRSRRIRRRNLGRQGDQGQPIRRDKPT